MSAETYAAIATWSQIVGSLAFIVVVVILWQKFLAPAVLASQHRKNLEILEAEQRRDAAKVGIERAQETLATAEADVRAIEARSHTDARKLRERIAADAAAESDRVVRNAEGELERSRTAAREVLRADLLAKAVAIARRAASGVDEATDRRLIGEAVDTADRAGNA